ncbi:MAG: hypothetical protein HBSAPP02_26860 [Phycisphaerae bacterium]|nr:MAG: hypothetical protein HBSAPP02_26860 [Phycisphaerae bacterium]
MRVSLKIAEPIKTANLSDSLARRIRLALGRFEALIERTHVFLDHEANSGNRRNCRCRLKISLRSAQGFFIEIRDPDAESAVRRAIDRAAWLVREHVEERTRDF